jgi:predicted O-methyltransferase YrrM
MKREELTARIKDLYEKYHGELTQFQEALAPHYPGFKASLMRRYKAARLQRLEGVLEYGDRLKAECGDEPYTEEERRAAGEEMLKHMEKVGTEFTDGTGGPQSVELENEINWLMIRDLKPDIVIELGPCSGWSTAYLIDAVLRNETGKVISYDILDHSVENIKRVWRWADGSPEGQTFDPISRGFWELRKGDTAVTFDFDAILDEGKIGYVSIDSDHSGDHARWYIKEILEKIPAGCGVAIHDIVQSKTGECPDPRVDQHGEPFGPGSRFDVSGKLVHGVDDHEEGKVVWEYLTNNQISYINPNPGPRNETVGSQIGVLRRSHSKDDVQGQDDWLLPGPIHDCKPWWSSAVFYIKS